MKPLRETLESLYYVIFAHHHHMGGNSIATDAGTAYRTEKKSASLADSEAFMDYVIAN
jgi:hypothetical protein